MALSRICQQGDLFLDASGGQVMLRGVNLGGDSKVPWPDGGTQQPGDFADHRSVSFIGRPFPLAEADEHLGRLAHWVFNVLRLLTTWEAVEHAGPGLYDLDYLEYFSEVCRRAGRHGLYLFVDFHQDVWSRMSGGDGAPGWLFEALGIDFTRFDAAGCAHIMQARYRYDVPARLQASYPPMSWGSNYRLPVNGILWSLFWGGRHFTPQWHIDGLNVQEFLQRHYLGAVDQVAQRLRDLPNVLGFDTLNEPGLGWMGERMSYRHTAPSAQRPERPRIGPALSVLDCLGLARGVPTAVPLLRRNAAGIAVPAGETTLNAAAVSIWKPGASCPFERAGAYRMDGGTPKARDEDFFCNDQTGRLLSMTEDAIAPFFRRVAATIRSHQAEWSVFAELDPFAWTAGRRFPDAMPERSVNASHWYDVTTLYRKHFDPAAHYCAETGEPETSPALIGARFARQLGELASQAGAFPGGAPTLMGEFGMPFDLDEGAAYARWRAGGRKGLWDAHIQALTLMYDALDLHRLHSTQWNYCASNRNDLRIGDCWNQEDLSIFSRDQQEDPAEPNSGGRAIEGFCRPRVRRVQGRLGEQRFEAATARFSVRFAADTAIGGVTDLYIPRLRYPDGFVARVEGARVHVRRSPATQCLELRAFESGPVWLTIERIAADAPAFSQPPQSADGASVR